MQTISSSFHIRRTLNENLGNCGEGTRLQSGVCALNENIGNCGRGTLQNGDV